MACSSVLLGFLGASLLQAELETKQPNALGFWAGSWAPCLELVGFLEGPLEALAPYPYQCRLPGPT